MTRMRVYLVLIGMLLVLTASVQAMAQATPTAASTTEFEITGTVDSIETGTITISGQVIQTTQAEIKAQVAVGAFVKAHVSAGPNGTLVAREVELALETGTDFADDEMEIVGTVEAFTADTITIGGQVIQTTQAEIKAQIAVGVQLKVHLAVGADGGLMAREVELARERVRLTTGGSDDSSGHDLNDDRGNDSSGHDLNDDHGSDSSGHDINDDHGGDQNDNSGRDSGSDDHGGGGENEDESGHGGDD